MPARCIDVLRPACISDQPPSWDVLATAGAGAIGVVAILQSGPETTLGERLSSREGPAKRPVWPGRSTKLSVQAGILTYMGNASTARSDRFSVNQSAADNMENAGPGWYYDPDDEAIYRYWDGARWTDHCSDTVLSEVPG